VYNQLVLRGIRIFNMKYVIVVIDSVGDITLKSNILHITRYFLKRYCITVTYYSEFKVA